MLRRTQPARAARICDNTRATLFLSRIFFLCLLLIPAQSAPADTWRILALRVAFPPEAPDDETTSGNGAFDLRSFAEVQSDYRFPFDTPPHDRGYFQAHLQALASYYRDISGGRVQIEPEVYPRTPEGSYVLSTPLKEYGNGRTRREINERLVRLFGDAIRAADAAEGDGLDFSRFRAVAVFHAGLGGESGQALNDIPSAFITPDDLDRYADGPIPVDGGAHRVATGMILPEAISTDGRGGLNGTLVRFFANQLGLPGLSNFEDDLPAVGDWSLMDTGANNAVSAARLGLQNLTGDPADTTLVGYIPSRMLAWSRIRLGWLEPHVIVRDTTLRIAAPHVQSALPQAVKIPISTDEYFLLENRISRLAVHGRIPRVEFSRGADGGVWLSVDDYDAFIPGSGLLIWHVDDAVIRASEGETALNSNPAFRIAPFQYRRGISLEEADGLEDIGNVSASRVVQGGIISFSTIEGGPEDPFFAGNNTRFGPDTTPDTRSNLNYPTGISIEALGPPGDTITVAITFSRQQDAWPVTGLRPNASRAPRAADIAGDGTREILRPRPADATGEPSAWTSAGEPVAPFDLVSDFPPAVGDLIPSGEGAGRTELIFADGGTPTLYLNGRFVRASSNALPPGNAVLTAAPILARFPGNELTDIWGWSDGTVQWGLFAGTPGSAKTGASPVTGLAAGNFDDDPETELATLTQTGPYGLIDGATGVRSIGHVLDPLGPPVVSDLDRNGRDDLILLGKEGSILVLSDLRGPIGITSGRSVPGGAHTPPVLADLDGDGFVEILFGGNGRLWAMRFNGVLQTGAPLEFPLKDASGPIEAPPVLADLDGDGTPEIFVGSRGGLLYGLRANGRPLPGFPLRAVGPIRTSPLIDDLDGDGTLELAAFTENGAIHLWHLDALDPSYTGNRIVWGQLGGGPTNAGRLLQPPGAPPPEPGADLLPPGRVYCYPNPIRGHDARLRFYLGDEARVSAIIFNPLGEIVDRLTLDAPVPRTDNEIFWDTTNYASGLYICRIEAVSSTRSEVRFVKAAVIR